MKRLMKIVLGLFVVLGAGSYGLWYFATESLIKELDNAIKNEFKMADASFSYDVEKYGYPTMVGVKLSNYKTSLKNPDGSMTLSIDMTGDTHYFVSLLDVLTAPGTFRAKGDNLKVMVNANSVTGETEEFYGSFRVDLGQITGSGRFDALREFTSELQDLDFYAIEKDNSEERLFTLDKVNYRGSYNEDSYDMVHADSAIDIEGATLMNPMEKNTISFDKILVDVGYGNMPKSGAVSIIDAIQKMQENGDARPVKALLKVYIEDMVKKKSSLRINEIVLKTEGISVKANGVASVGAREMLNAAAAVHIEANNSIKKILPPGAYEELTSTPFGKQLLGGTAKFDLNARVENGYAVINGMPLLSVPSLTTFVQLIPNNVNTLNEAEHLEGAYVAPETHTEDLLGHFKKEEEMLKAKNAKTEVAMESISKTVEVKAKDAAAAVSDTAQ